MQYLCCLFFQPLFKAESIGKDELCYKVFVFLLEGELLYDGMLLGTVFSSLRLL